MSRPATAERRSMLPQEWPPADRAAWQLANQAFDPLEPEGGYASRWRDGTILEIQRGYGHWLTWLDLHDGLDRGTTPASRVDRDKVRAYLAAMREASLADYTIAGRLAGLGDALRAMCPDDDFTWVTRAAERIRSTARPAKRIEERLRPADEIEQLGLDLMQVAETAAKRSAIDLATLYRDGLIIAYLIHRPSRLANLGTMSLGHELVRIGANWKVGFEADQMKNGAEFLFSWPDVLVPALERYLDRHRPVLVGDARDVDALWVARGGRRLGNAAIYAQITSRTRKAFGKPINPHAFRTAAATTIATASPEQAPLIARVLSHKSLKIADKHYNKAKSREAGARYHQTIRKLRSGR